MKGGVVIPPNELLMPEESSRFIETWIVVINKTKYSLTQNQAELLRRAINSGNRGIITFDQFSISIPYIEEFYLESKTLNPKYQLEQGEIPEISEEQRQRNLKKIEELRNNLLRKKGIDKGSKR